MVGWIIVHFLLIRKTNLANLYQILVTLHNTLIFCSSGTINKGYSKSYTLLKNLVVDFLNFATSWYMISIKFQETTSKWDYTSALPFYENLYGQVVLFLVHGKCYTGPYLYTQGACILYQLSFFGIRRIY